MKIIIMDIQNSLKNINYICYDENTNEALIIDPIDHQLVKDHLDKYQLTPKVLFKTHNHFDHIAGIEKVLELYPKINYLRYEDDQLLFDKEFSFTQSSNISLQVIKLFGHTKDQIGLITRDKDLAYLFSGDALFHYGIGNIKNGGDIDLYYECISELKKHTLNLTHFYPAHNYLKKNIEFMISVIGAQKTKELIPNCETIFKDDSFDQANNLDYGFENQLKNNLFFNLDLEALKNKFVNQHAKDIFINLRKLRDVF